MCEICDFLSEVCELCVKFNVTKFANISVVPLRFLNILKAHGKKNNLGCNEAVAGGLQF